MVSKTLFVFILHVNVIAHVNAVTKPGIDKNPWKPITTSKSGRNNARQYHPAPSHSQSFSGQQQHMMARPVTYVPPAVQFNPPQVLYGNPTISRAVASSSPSSQYRQVNVPPSHPSLPSYAAPAQSYQYQLITQPTMITTPPPMIQSITYHVVPQPSTVTSSPQAPMQFYSQQAPTQIYSQQAPTQIYSPHQPSARSYGPPQGYFQLVKQPVSEMTPPLLNTLTATTPAPAVALESSPPPPVQANGSNPDNATFVDVVTVLSKYVRATGTQLSEMFTQLNNHTELNAWNFNTWTTPTTTTTTTTPAPATAPPHYQPPVVVMPIMMPAPPAPTHQISYSQPPPQPIYTPLPSPPAYTQPLPPPIYAHPPLPQLQPSYSEHQPLYSQPPPSYHPSPSYSHSHSHPPVLSHPLPTYHHEKMAHHNNDLEISNSIEQDYYYDCDK